MLGINKLGAPFFAALLFLGCSVTVRAQEGGTEASPAQNTMHRGPRANRLERLGKQLNLTDEQKTKVGPILDDEAKQMRSVRGDASLSQQQRQEKMKQLHETADSQINDLLTPEQQKKFAELKAQQKARHEGTKKESPQP